MLFTPRQSKYKKRQKGKRINSINNSLGLIELKYGKICLKTTNFGNIDSKQIESMRKTINKIIKKNGKFKINIFPHAQVTKKPTEVRMGKGKGNVAKWICKVKNGATLCEIETTNMNLGIKALKLTQFRLPIKTKIFYY